LTASADSAYDRVIAALEAHGATRRGRDWTCPAHDDSKPSLSVDQGAKGGAVLKCQTGCQTSAVVTALGLSMADLFDDRIVPASRIATPSRVEAAYPYVDESGAVLFEVLRKQPKGEFPQRRPDGRGGWIYKLDGVRRVPFRLPEVISAAKSGADIFVVEGEKDVLAIEAAGAVATCNPGGSGKWRDEYSPHFRGATVIVVADRDKAGRDHAGAVAASLQRAGVASVRIVEAVTGKDAYDHLTAGHTLADFAPMASSPALDDAGQGSTWTPIDVAAVLAGGVSPIQPTHLWCDAFPLLYPTRHNGFHGEQESMKSWAAQIALAEVLKAGSVAFMLDNEAEARDVFGRLLALEVPAENLIANFIYARPDEPPTDEDLARLFALLDERRPEVSVIDGVDAGMALEGLNPDKDFRRWHGRIVRPIQQRTTGPTVTVDHVVKNKDNRGDYAAGDRAKRSVIDGASFGFEKVEDFGKGRVGIARILLHKDRAGALRAHQGNGREIARMRLTSHEDGHVTWELQAPGAGAAEGVEQTPWQPTHLMERVSLTLEGADHAMTMREIERYRMGKTDYVRQAVRELVTLAYVTATPGDRRSILHRSVRPFREVSEPLRPTAPLTAPLTNGTHSVETAPPTASPPKGGRTQGAVDVTTQASLIPDDRAPGRSHHSEAIGL
jgi:Toprim domain